MSLSPALEVVLDTLKNLTPFGHMCRSPLPLLVAGNGLGTMVRVQDNDLRNGGAMRISKS